MAVRAFSRTAGFDDLAKLALFLELLHGRDFFAKGRIFAQVAVLPPRLCRRPGSQSTSRPRSHSAGKHATCSHRRRIFPPLPGCARFALRQTPTALAALFRSVLREVSAFAIAGGALVKTTELQAAPGRHQFVRHVRGIDVPFCARQARSTVPSNSDHEPWCRSPSGVK